MDGGQSNHYRYGLIYIHSTNNYRRISSCVGSRSHISLRARDKHVLLHPYNFEHCTSTGLGHVLYMYGICADFYLCS